MTHCLYHAWQAHIHHLTGTNYVPLALDVYFGFRGVSGNGNGPTWGGIAPACITVMAAIAGYDVRVEHRLWTREHYAADARADLRDGCIDHTSWLSRICLVKGADFGEEVHRITLEPAIYLLLNQAHAVFRERVPEKGGPIMALQVYKREEK